MVVLGDSFVTPGCYVKPQDSFWGLLANDLGVSEIDNYATPTFSLDSIIHILLNEQIDFNRYLIVGIPPLTRESVYLEGHGFELKRHNFKNWLQTDYNISSLENVKNMAFTDKYSNDYSKINLFSAEWLEVLSLEKIFFIHTYLKSINANFVILNLSWPFQYQDLWPAGMNIIKRMATLQECNLFENTYQSINAQDGIKPADYAEYGQHGHHGPEGNLNYYQKVVKPMVEKLGWFSV